MSKENDRTIGVYKNMAQAYLDNSAEHDKQDPEKAKRKQAQLRDLIRTILSSIPKNAKVFEIGAADGANSEYMQSLGYDITASDTAEPFINAIRKGNIKTIQFNVLEDEFPEQYFAIFCWRVFVHFTKDDALKVIKKAYEALEDNGVFIFNAINRDTTEVDSEWKDFEGEYHMGVERYYNYYRKEEVDEMISKTDFKVDHFNMEGGNNKNKWLVYVLKK